MSAPYWGQLPPPHTGDASRPRTSSGDHTPGHDRRPSLDVALQGPQRPNRVSVQTTKSDAPTDSTLSPFASPTASSFQGQGLAPRPPSLPYGANEYPPELIENRRKRRSRYQEQDEEYIAAAAAGPPLPAAPEAPLSASTGSRYPPSSSGLPQSYPTPPGVPQASFKKMDADEYPVLDRAQRTLDESAMPRPPRTNTVPSMTANGAESRPRRTSAAEQSLQRSARRSSAYERQKIISKEDKRARVEAAERRVRERNPANGMDPSSPAQPPSSQTPMRKQRRPSSAVEDEAITPSRPPHSSHGQNGPLSQNPPEEGQVYTGIERSPRGQAPEPRTPLPVGQTSGIPQRNLSFRERAAKNDIKLPNALDEAAPSPDAPSIKSPPRSGSNKLKKHRPTEAWPNRISESSELHVGETTPKARSLNGTTPSVRSKEAYEDDQDDDYYPRRPAKLQKTPSQRKADQVLGRVPSNTVAANGKRQASAHSRGSRPHSPVSPAAGAVVGAGAGATAAAAAHPPHHHTARRDNRSDSDSDDEHSHRVSNMLYHGRDKYQPGEGIFKPTSYLDEWQHAPVGALTGALLDLEEAPSAQEKNGTWWETPQGRTRSSSLSSRPKKAEAFIGEYDDINAPTRFKPPLYLKCGPLLRYCGIRHERVPNRSARNGATMDREIWRGSIMIVTTDKDSSYDIAPTLRLFAQPIELLPPPPREVRGDEPLAPEYVDPIAGHPKLGRKGETLYVRPVEHLDDNRDSSVDETDNGLFEKTKSLPDVALPGGVVDLPGSFAARRKRAETDGEKAGKYKDIRGFRLHAERGYTFWRFNIEVELKERQQRIAYRINRGPSTGFWVPAKGETMNIMFYSCNGFSMSVNPDNFTGPDPMWRDVLNTHQSQPFHVMIGGGDQIYNDRAMQDTRYFREWLMIKNPLHKHNAPFTPELQDELETFYLERYATWFSQGLFGMANSQIPMVNMFDDHDIIDGFGSYPHHFMNSPVFSGLGNVAFKYYMLFQHQSVTTETEKSEPSWTLGVRPGPYINELSRSMFMYLGSEVALLAVDARTERTREEVIREDTWKKIMDRCYGEIDKGKVKHLLVLLGVPIAYPRLVWLENILTSRAMDPIKALGKMGLFKGLLNRFDGGVEVLDDLDDHWTAKSHKHERSIVVEDLQDLAADKSVRVTILSGDVHLAAIGQFYSNPKLGLPKHKDFRYMPNIISSAIVNTPPPDLMADILNKRNKVHHFDKETDEDMIPIFAHGVDGKPRNNKHLLPHRNWCAIRPYVPGHTPEQTPNGSDYDLTPVASPTTPGGGKRSLFRRLSGRARASSFRGPDSVQKDRSRPPISNSFMRSMSSKNMASADDFGRPSPAKPNFLTRTLSGSSVSGSKFRGLFRRRSSSSKQRDDGGINGNWGPETDEDDGYDEEVPRNRGHSSGGVGLRGGLGEYTHGNYSSPHNNEFAQGDESYFSVKPPGSQHNPPPPQYHPNPSREKSVTVVTGTSAPAAYSPAAAGHNSRMSYDDPDFVPKPFHRTPTALSAKQLKNAENLSVNLEGGLEVTLNVEISPKDPGGSTVPYRLVVPQLWYEYEGEEPEDLTPGEVVSPQPQQQIPPQQRSQSQQQIPQQPQQRMSFQQGRQSFQQGRPSEEGMMVEKQRGGGLRRLFSKRRSASTPSVQTPLSPDEGLSMN
ncbi:hypothetical protein QBC35DRAFT_279575 [Podospora australis]|uniref:PhoD-like phosphatase domain-containing protein n=1 Tax=Podospora australis TaxID=1536484 RepID=A0AAN7AM76_9PEZI|nr:hypothetical protein QBC35DRAFT_279575 [Podospora australis]